MARRNIAADQYFMEIALRLSRRNLGNTAPNPSVGCVLVKGGKIIGRGWTAKGGRPHAETQAINWAGKNAKGATAYVTLEPCCHHGKTPPCTKALIVAGIKRVVVAALDPDKRMCGNGIKELEEAGIEVVVGVGRKEAEEINAGFFLAAKKQRPFVTLKMAVSSDGKIGIKGKRVQISGEMAGAYSHVLRKTHDAIMVGMNTVLCDDPELTCRLPGLEDCSPIRIVMGNNNCMPKDSKLLKNRKTKLWIINNRNIEETLKMLAERGVTRLLVEGGAKLSKAVLDQGLVDQLIVIKSKEVTLAYYDNAIKAPEVELEKFKQNEKIFFNRDEITIYESY